MTDYQFDDEMWDYAQLSYEAKQCGGPEQLLRDVFNMGISEGETKGILEVLIPVCVIVLTGGIAFGAKKIYDYKKKKKQNAEQLKRVQTELADYPSDLTNNESPEKADENDEECLQN